MKKIIFAVLAAALLLTGCGKKQAEKPDSQVDNSYSGTESVEKDADDSHAADAEADIPTDLAVVEDENASAENRAVATGLLDCFQKLDYEGALAWVRESDRELLDVESARANAAYSALLPRMTYELGDSLTDSQGGRYIRVSITAPSMQDIYGQVFIKMNDAIMNGEINSEEEAAAFNNEAIMELAADSEAKMKTMDVNIALESEGGSLRARLTPELLNAMLGDIQNAANEINETVNETANSYNAAKASGDLD